MATVQELRRKPIDGLPVQDMRLLIRQNVAIRWPPWSPGVRRNGASFPNSGRNSA
ncbi:hypothetical protein ABT026_22090 [Streptomyces sp. NPDC002734]|uniref:hypothetical protein n=1 Tax=Streptomyces sp. NPDC002734 TaxID=3154426 RepID=UPI00331F04F0